MLALWLAAGVLGQGDEGGVTPPPAPVPFGGGGAWAIRPIRARYILRKTEEAQEQAARGRIDEAAQAAALAIKAAEAEARRAEQEDADALNAIARQIAEAMRRAEDARNRTDMQRLAAMTAYREAVQAAFALQARLRSEDDEFAVLALLTLH
jgi:hypothetical protein